MKKFSAIVLFTIGCNLMPLSHIEERHTTFTLISFDESFNDVKMYFDSSEVWILPDVEIIDINDTTIEIMVGPSPRSGIPIMIQVIIIENEELFNMSTMSFATMIYTSKHKTKYILHKTPVLVDTYWGKRYNLIFGNNRIYSGVIGLN